MQRDPLPARRRYTRLAGSADALALARLAQEEHPIAVVSATALDAQRLLDEIQWFSPQLLGEKLLAVNLSDLAAMGHVKPLAALITVALPGDTPVDSVDKFYQGLRSYAQRWKVGFLGGDTVGSRRGWFVSATVLGEAKPQELVRRTGAREGDWIAVIGDLGMAAGGLEALVDVWA